MVAPVSFSPISGYFEIALSFPAIDPAATYGRKPMDLTCAPVIADVRKIVKATVEILSE